MRYIKTIALVAFAAILALPSIAQFRTSNAPTDFDKAMKKYGTTLFLINNYYVDTANITNLVDQAVISTMKSLDPHSNYISKEEFNAMNEPLQGNFEGIGIEFNILQDTLLVVSPISGGPSERLGIRTSDRIIAVNGENIAGVGLTNERVFKLLRGPKGSKIQLTVWRHSSREKIEFTVIRDKIPIFSMDAAYEVKPGVVYIKLSRFAINSMDEIKKAFAEFKNPTALILDLRGNGGGILSTSIELANQFFGAGKLLVYTEGMKSPKQMELSTDNGMFQQGKLVVLIDEGSASASEIVSGAVQDWDRGIIIGRRSFGKGLVQQQFPLGDGSYLRLTVARYHTPTGRIIQRPYDNGKIEKYYEDLYKRYSDGEVYHQDSIKFPDSLKYQTLKNKRTVYGGGGIMPDIFIPMDTSNYSKYSGQLYRKGTLNQFVLGYMEKNRDAFKAKYKNFNEFNSKFDVDKELFEQLVTYAENDSIPRNNEDIAKSGNEISSVVKALVARDLFGMSAYFQVVNARGDKTYDKALEVIDKWPEYDRSILHNNQVQSDQKKTR